MSEVDRGAYSKVDRGEAEVCSKPVDAVNASADADAVNATATTEPLWTDGRSAP